MSERDGKSPLMEATEELIVFRARVAALEEALREVWESVPSSYREDDPMVQRHAQALNAIPAALARPTPTPPRHLSFCASLQRSDWPCDCEPPTPEEHADKAEARVAALEAENERLRVQLEGTKRVRLRTEELVREVDVERASVAALEAALKLFATQRFSDEDWCWWRIGEVGACKPSSSSQGGWYHVGNCAQARAALARPTPTPQGEALR